ncbi:MAG TPA: signal peptidase II [Trueperaceae bacterium]|nr:signal peptidase II [Trueperaceae bacterium]
MALLLAAVLVAADQLSKAWVVSTLPLGSREVPLGLGFYILHTRNNGAAFGIFRNVHLRLDGLIVDGTFLLGVLSALVGLAVLATLLGSGRRLAGLTRASLALVLAGAWGNMIDRFRLGYVVDFVHFHVTGFDFPVFNLADACIVVGAALLLLASLFVTNRPGERAGASGSPEGPRGADPGRPRHDDRSEALMVDFPELPPLRRERGGDGPGSAEGVSGRP